MTTETPPQETEPVRGFWRLVPEPSLDVVRRWGWASVAVNIGIVVTGGLVRLTGSGLGCPTWPRCTAESFVAHPALGIYEVNRRIVRVPAAVIRNDGDPERRCEASQPDARDRARGLPARAPAPGS